MTVDSVFRHWMSLTVEDESATYERQGMELGRSMGMFYEDASMIETREPEWLQGDINVLIGLFRRVRLMDNVAK